MSYIAIQARNVYKSFPLRRAHGHALRERIETSMLTPVRGSSDGKNRGPLVDDDDPRWALRNVSLTVTHGECVGLIGHNGAGKSVLLRVLARVTHPTRGEADIQGSVATVLEVGAGFDRELTGRENIYLQGAVLGMRRVEIASKFDSIVAFSGLEEFLDSPLKTFSSGMKVRLAFAIAAELEPDIFLMDEVLAVADADFVATSVRKMLELAQEGRTIILVGHDLEMLAEVCPRIIWMEHGSIVADGAAQTIIADYRAHLASAKRALTA